MHTSDFLRPPDPARSCFTCRWWRATVPPVRHGRSITGGHVVCGHAHGLPQHMPEHGCAFWSREPGSDDHLPGSDDAEPVP